jgi:hypothetical protein
MSKTVMLSMLAQGNTGSEILSILDALTADNVSGFDYIESPQIESVLGIPTLEEIAF